MKQTLIIPKDMEVPCVKVLPEDIFEQYLEIMEKFVKDAPESCRYWVRNSLDIFFDNEDLEGSNCFANLVLRECLSDSQRLATTSNQELGGAIERERDKWLGNYYDTGICIRSAGDSRENDLIAINLAKQLKKRGMIAIPEKPVVLFFNAVKPVINRNSPYGLIYKIRDSAEINKDIIPNAVEISHENPKNEFSRYDERGMPILEDEGKYYIWRRDKGLSRFCVDASLGLGSAGRLLASSSENGRIAVMEY